MGHVRKLLAMLLFASVASASTTYYEKTTIPPTIASGTVLGNSGATTAVPTALTILPFGTMGCPYTITNPTTFGTGLNCWVGTTIVTGTQSGASQYAPFYWIYTDSYDGSTNTSGNPDAMMYTKMNLNSGWAHGRDLLNAEISINASPPTTDSNPAAVTHQINMRNTGFDLGGTDYDSKGQFWGMDINVINGIGANYQALYGGLEIDNNIKGGSIETHFGLEINKSSTNVTRGYASDAAIIIGNANDPTGNAANWRTGIMFGNPGAWGMNSDSTLLAVQPHINTTSLKVPLADYGIDFRTLSATSGVAAFPNSGIDPSGNVYGGNLYTASGLAAKNGTIASIAPAAWGGITGGAYFNSSSFPTLTIQAPPNSGTQATATVATMKLTVVGLTKGTDVGCTNGDVLTLTGGTGTQATITLTVAAGAVSSVVVTTAGSYTVKAASPGTTGGTCSVQPAFNFGFGIATVTVTNAGTGYPPYPLPVIQFSGSGANNAHNRTAVLIPTMSTANATLTINGGATVDSTGLLVNGSALAINKNASTNTTEIGDGTTSGTVTVGGGSNAVTVNGTTTTVTGTTVSINASASTKVTNIGTGNTTGAVTVGNSGNITHLGPTMVDQGTTFTVGTATGCGTTNGTPTSVTGGAYTGSFVSASSGTLCTFALTPNGATGATAANGWYCDATDMNTLVKLPMSGKTTTTCSVRGTVGAITDTILVNMVPY